MGNVINALFAFFNRMGIVNLGLQVVAFTVVLKLVTLPLDFLSKRATKSMSRKQEKIKPQLERLNKQYADDKQTLQKKQQELYKKEKISPMGSCVYMILPLIIFIVVWGAFSAYTNDKNAAVFEEIAFAYRIDYNNPTDEEKQLLNYGEYERVYFESYDAAKVGGKSETNAVIYAKGKVSISAFERNRNSFLWVKNLANPDTFWARFIDNYEDYLKKRPDSPMSAGEFNSIIQPILEQEGSTRNGLLILPAIGIIAIVLSTLITQKQNKQMQAAGGAAAGTNIMMMIMMPIMAGVFLITYSAAFAIYSVFNTILSILINIALTAFFNAKYRREDEREIASNYRTR